MAIYITARKIEETEDHVIYACGNSPEKLFTKISINKTLWERCFTDSQSLKTSDVITVLSGGQNCYWFVLLGKMMRYYHDHNSFPDKITKQS